MRDGEGETDQGMANGSYRLQVGSTTYYYTLMSDSHVAHLNYIML